jgi:hypothetical protein
LRRPIVVWILSFVMPLRMGYKPACIQAWRSHHLRVITPVFDWRNGKGKCKVLQERHGVVVGAFHDQQADKVVAGVIQPF